MKDYEKFSNIDVMVLSGGKTGTSTLVRSFRQCHKKTIQIHNNYQFRNIIQYGENENDKVDLGYIIQNNAKNGRKTLVVSAYREPISRAISSFFEHICLDTKNHPTDPVHFNCSIKELEGIKIEEVVNKFNNDHLLRLENYHPYNDIFKYCGIDVFSKPFSHSQLYNKYKNEEVCLVVLRFDKISEWTRIIREATGFGDFSLVSDNVSSEKNYSGIYKSFKDNYRIPEDLTNLVFEWNKDLLEYFYSPGELAQLKRSWLDKATSRLFFPNDFNWQRYLALNSDLGPAGVTTELEAKMHYYNHGRCEKRRYR